MAELEVPYQKRKSRAAELLDEVGLAHRMQHLSTMMSGGEQQRVTIALSNDPEQGKRARRVINLLVWEGSTNGPSSYMEELRQSVQIFSVSLSLLGMVLIFTFFGEYPY